MRRDADVENAAPDPDLALSSFLPPAFGLNHYPNYLYRYRRPLKSLQGWRIYCNNSLRKFKSLEEDVRLFLKSNFLSLYLLQFNFFFFFYN